MLFQLLGFVRFISLQCFVVFVDSATLQHSNFPLLSIAKFLLTIITVWIVPWILFLKFLLRCCWVFFFLFLALVIKSSIIITLLSIIITILVGSCFILFSLSVFFFYLFFVFYFTHFIWSLLTYTYKQTYRDLQIFSFLLFSHRVCLFFCFASFRLLFPSIIFVTRCSRVTLTPNAEFFFLLFFNSSIQWLCSAEALECCRPYTETIWNYYSFII